ncbi:amino acid/amide ABC transporter ATP-binding protein 1 (HAAT family) [Stella humosa]|uniref:Amino acid/amide ABC transporter ATP-binding protein 1 (HAAT family) n=1 Tax=Stella humosa TaxID=94 RepID=A0A3N1M9I2_9PROT|nr:ABC transporter ATP-binding protein [Stella humosa]ROQ00343.1 amino acid/amide ABC transporter ATP-binding protein 1 (HAAT family) [Stella humosa]
MTAILEVRGLTVKFGDFVAVRDVSFDLAPGSIHSIIGPNGAGKTTLFNALTGRVMPTAGSVTFAGRDITRLPMHRRTVLGIGRSFQVTSLFAAMTVRQSLALACQRKLGLGLLGILSRDRSLAPAAARADELLAFLGLGDVAERKSGELSHGQQRRLEIGLALAARPQVVFLDEPTAGMGIDDIDAVRRLIREIARTCTVVLIEHNMAIVMGISDTITVMFQGEVLVEGPPDAIRADRRVQMAYLGEVA